MDEWMDKSKSPSTQSRRLFFLVWPPPWRAVYVGGNVRLVSTLPGITLSAKLIIIREILCGADLISAPTKPYT